MFALAGSGGVVERAYGTRAPKGRGRPRSWGGPRWPLGHSTWAAAGLSPPPLFSSSLSSSPPPWRRLEIRLLLAMRTIRQNSSRPRFFVIPKGRSLRSLWVGACHCSRRPALLVERVGEGRRCVRLRQLGWAAALETQGAFHPDAASSRQPLPRRPAP